MANFIVAGIVIILVITSVVYMRKEKKKGVKCIGCPMGGSCGSANGNGCGGNCHSGTK